jgi:hypothetical protein
VCNQQCRRFRTVVSPLLSSRSATVRVHPPSFRVVVGCGREARPCRSVQAHEAPPEEVLPRPACAVSCNIRGRHNTLLFANRIVDCRGQIFISLSSVVHIVHCGQMSKRDNIFFSALTSDTNHIFPTVHHPVLRHSLSLFYSWNQMYCGKKIAEFLRSAHFLL